MSAPNLPLALCGSDLTTAELAELWQKIVVELMNSDYVGRTHGNRRTYDAGCKGPICGKAVREHGRRRTQTAPNERYKYLDPIIDFYWKIAVERIEAAREAMLAELTG